MLRVRIQDGGSLKGWQTLSIAGRAGISGFWVLSFLVLARASWTGLAFPPDAVLQEDLDYRKGRLAWMRSERSPLALAGLFWLKEGKNHFGSGKENDIALPAGSAPDHAGYFELKGKTVSVHVDSGAVVELNGQRVRTRDDLKTDAAGASPDILRLNQLRMKVIHRGGKLALRMANLKNPLLLSFRGIDFYAIDPALRVEAQFVAYEPRKRIKIAAVAGYVEELECPGFARFEIGGVTHQLEPVLESPGDTKLFFMFKDATNGKETYGGGRYLYSELPVQGRVWLNFNQAHNPYCAYNSYSTCLVPPLQNWLKIPIRAGEKKYPRSH